MRQSLLEILNNDTALYKQKVIVSAMLLGTLAFSDAITSASAGGVEETFSEQTPQIQTTQTQATQTPAAKAHTPELYAPEVPDLRRKASETNEAEQASAQKHALTPELETINTEVTDADSKTKKKRKPGCKVRPDSEEWVDRMRSRTHSSLCFTASWIDGLFGDEHQFNGKDFRGKVALGFREDEVEGFDPRLRVRVKTKLPNASNRFNAFIGRVEEDSYVSNTEVDQDRVNSVGLRSTNDEDSEWLIGIGYRDPLSQDNGFDVSVGAKLSSGFAPYAKLAHRHLFKASDKDYWRTTQTIFWRKQDGYGVSSNLDYTHLLSDKDILEWDTSVKHTEEEQQWEWITSATWHHEFTSLKGISSRAYVRGEEENPVSVPEFGLTFTYVRPFLRDWLFVETGVDLRWEKETPEQLEYKSAIRFGIQFQMLLGDYYKLGKK